MECLLIMIINIECNLNLLMGLIVNVSRASGHTGEGESFNGTTSRKRGPAVITEAFIWKHGTRVGQGIICIFVFQFHGGVKWCISSEQTFC